MKYLIPLLLLSSVCYGQKDTMPLLKFFPYSRISTGFPANMGSEVLFWDDGKIDIIGDTLTAIKAMYKHLQARDSTISSLYGFMGAAVDFSNHVPDYWRNGNNNCKWDAFNKQLKKNGYYTTKLKKPIDCK